MKDQLKRILSLVRKTGDTMIVTDTDGKDAYVVMDLDQYELFLGFSGDDEEGLEEGPIGMETEEMGHYEPLEEELPPVEEPVAQISEELPDVWGMMPSAGEEAQTWDLDKLSDREREELEEQYQAFVAQNVQEAVGETIPAPVQEPELDLPESEEEQVSEAPQEQSSGSDDDFGEEQFYLEPIE
jgi:hypothetical protein